MSINASKARLLALTKELSLKWDETQEVWKDAKCREFDQKYMKDLFAGVDNAAVVIDQLDKLVQKIRSDCE